MVVVLVLVAEVRVVVMAVQVMLQVMVRAKICVVPTWRTGQEEFKALMKKKVPACTVYV